MDELPQVGTNLGGINDEFSIELAVFQVHRRHRVCDVLEVLNI